MSVAMTANDRRWQAEDDARTLAQSIVIQNDEKRMEAAKQAAERMAEEKREEASAMGSVARRGKGSGSGGNVKGGAKKPSDNKSKTEGVSNKFNVFQKI